LGGAGLLDGFQSSVFAMDAKLFEERTVFKVGTPTGVERIGRAPDFRMSAAYFVINWRSNVAAERKRLAFTLDISVLLLCFFPASPFLEPHHLVVLLVPAVCLAGILLSRDFERKYRIIAGSTLAAGLILTEAIRNPYRSMGVMLTVMIYLIGIYLIRRGFRLPRQAHRNPDSDSEAIGFAKSTV
jgi:hypothetical protein